MKTMPKMDLSTKLAVIFIAVCVVIMATLWLLPRLARRGKSDGVFAGMEGTVTNISVNGDDIHLQMSGRFWLTQWHGPHLAQHSVMEVNCDSGLPATLTQGEIFIATTPDERGGAVRHEKGELLRILKVAAERSRVVKFELTEPVIAFGHDGHITNLISGVVRATDADLH